MTSWFTEGIKKAKQFLFGEDGQEQPQHEDRQRQSSRHKHHGTAREHSKKSKAVGRPVPVIQDAHDGNGGVQGLTFYTLNLRADDDGDIAHGFFMEQGRNLVSQQDGTPLTRPLMIKSVEKGNLVLTRRPTSSHKRPG